MGGDIMNASSCCRVLSALIFTALLFFTGADAQAAYGDLPLSFEPNHGQADPQVKFVSRGGGYTLYLSEREIAFALVKPPVSKGAQSASSSEGKEICCAFDGLRMQFFRANPNPQIEAQDRLPGETNYLIGNDATKWLRGVPNFSKIVYRNLYPGIDLLFYGDRRRLEYDLVVSPGADPGVIGFELIGAQNFEIDPKGDLIIRLPGQTIRQHKPVIYQIVDGRKRIVEGSYRLDDVARIGFDVAAYDKTKPLIIDPIVLAHASFIGGDALDSGLGIAVDASGAAYVVGWTLGYTNFPGAPLSTSSSGSVSAFITKINPAGNAVVYSTLIGGSDHDEAQKVAVDSQGNAFVVGATRSANFPTVSASQPSLGSPSDFDAFVLKLNPAGNALIYSTFLGGSAWDHGHGIAVDSADNAYVTGSTHSQNFPVTTGAFQTSLKGPGDAFVAKFSPAGVKLYVTLLGGNAAAGGINGMDSGSSIAVDSAGHAYVTGAARSNDFPTAGSPFQSALSGTERDIFVAKLNPAGTGLIYSTYIGGAGDDEGRHIVIDATGHAYVVGRTGSTNFPTTAGAFQSVFPGPSGTFNGFVIKLNPTGSVLIYSTYLGGSITPTNVADSELADGLAVDGAGYAYITGQTSTTNFPLAGGPIQSSPMGLGSIFVSKLNPTGTGLVYSTYLGGNGNDSGAGLALDGNGCAYVTGTVSSSNFPPAGASFKATNNGGPFDAFVAKLCHEETPTPDPDKVFQYAAKFICGIQEKDGNILRLARGMYATSINIHNPGPKDADFRKRIALAYPPAEQKPGRVTDFVKDKLGPGEALKVDCEDISKNFLPQIFPAATPYVEGFVTIQSANRLDVVGVYTTGTLGWWSQLINRSSVDVEYIPGQLVSVK